MTLRDSESIAHKSCLLTIMQFYFTNDCIQGYTIWWQIYGFYPNECLFRVFHSKFHFILEVDVYEFMWWRFLFINYHRVWKCHRKCRNFLDFYPCHDLECNVSSPSPFISGWKALFHIASLEAAWFHLFITLCSACRQRPYLLLSNFMFDADCLIMLDIYTSFYI